MLRQLGGDPGRGALTTTLPSAQPAFAPPQPGIESLDALGVELMAAFRAADEEGASAVVTEALSLYSVEDVLLKLLQPALIEVGEAWLRREISVAAEHFASAFVRNRLSNLFHASQYNATGPLVLVACAPEEFHELGSMFLSVFLRRSGYKVVYLGQNVPLDSLEGMIEVMNPDVVCVSATRAETAAHLYSLRDFLDELKARRGRAPLLTYGGQVFNRFPHITERLGGAYLGEDAVHAVRRLNDHLSSAKPS
jgi:methanogenic corrinoid protein MtbC1